MFAYLYDETLKKACNQQGFNYWDAYLPEICGQLGVSAQALSSADLEEGRCLQGLRGLIIGGESGRKLSDGVKQNLTRWVSEGGLLIGFAVPGLDQVFGHELIAKRNQQRDDYTLSGYFTLLHHALTHDIHSVLFQEQKLLIFSDLFLVKPTASHSLANLFASDQSALGTPAITWNAYGRGHAGYFVFDAAKTIWLLHQGRPLPPDLTGRATELSLIGHNSRKVPYADELVMVIQNMIAVHYPQPMVYPIPPEGKTIPDALLFWGGDCCAGDSAGFVRVSNWMKARGLPYHFNVHYIPPDCRELNLDPADAAIIRQNGHEISLHYRFDRGINAPLTQAAIKAQVDAFERKYGFKPVCSVVHGTLWKGWTEPAEWMLAAGVTADNSFAPGPFPVQDSFGNGPFFGFGFGTTYPFFFVTDHRNGNRHLDFLEEPIVCYEMGHYASFPPFDKIRSSVNDLCVPIDLAVKHHWIMNVFYHPVYIDQSPHCGRTIETALNYIKQQGYKVRHMAPDRVAEWWLARARVRIDCLDIQPDSIRFECQSDYPDGIIIKVPLAGRKAVGINNGTKACPFTVKEEFGNTWAYMVLPQGTCHVSVACA